MSRKRNGSIVTKNGRIYARIQFTDESNKKRDIWRKASSKAAAKDLIKTLIAEFETKTAEEIDAARMNSAQLVNWYSATYLHEAIFLNERKISGIRNIKPNQYNLKCLRSHFGNRLIQSITR